MHLRFPECAVHLRAQGTGETRTWYRTAPPSRRSVRSIAFPTSAHEHSNRSRQLVRMSPVHQMHAVCRRAHGAEEMRTWYRTSDVGARAFERVEAAGSYVSGSPEARSSPAHKEPTRYRTVVRAAWRRLQATQTSDRALKRDRFRSQPCADSFRISSSTDETRATRFDGSRDEFANVEHLGARSSIEIEISAREPMHSRARSIDDPVASSTGHRPRNQFATAEN